MSHMSGIGRDLPPGNAKGHWPTSLFGGGPPGYNGLEFPSRQEVFDGIAKSRPVVPPYTYPVYSNAGYSLLGMANVAANIAANGPSAPLTHAELMQQDIFGPLGFNGSSFLVTEENIQNVVVPSLNPSEIVRVLSLVWSVTLSRLQDQDFTDTMNPAGGQMSPLSDLTKFMQVLINPQRQENILSPFTVREWIRPIHTWFDDYTDVGALWEIYTSTDSYGRKQKLYQKCEQKHALMNQRSSDRHCRSRRTSWLSHGVHAQPCQLIRYHRASVGTDFGDDWTHEAYHAPRTSSV